MLAFGRLSKLCLCSIAQDLEDRKIFKICIVNLLAACHAALGAAPLKIMVT